MARGGRRSSGVVARQGGRHADAARRRLGGPPRVGGRDPMNAPWPGPLGPPPDLPSIVLAVVAGVLLWQGRSLFDGLFRAPGRFAVLLVASIASFASAAYVDR